MLAADAQTQVAWLNPHGVMTDEIALDFDRAGGWPAGFSQRNWANGSNR